MDEKMCTATCVQHRHITRESWKLMSLVSVPGSICIPCRFVAQYIQYQMVLLGHIADLISIRKPLNLLLKSPKLLTCIPSYDL